MDKFNIIKDKQLSVVISTTLLNSGNVSEIVYNILNNNENVARLFMEHLIEKYSTDYTTIVYNFPLKQYTLTNTILENPESKIVIKQIWQDINIVSQNSFR